MVNKQQIVSSKNILTTELFTVREQTLQLSNGKEVIRHNVLCKPTVFIFPITPKYEIYLISEYRYMLEDTILGCIGGSVNTNEAPLHAAQRELQEETGIEALHWEMFAKVETARNVTRTTGFMYYAKELTIRGSHKEEDEEITLVKMPLAEAVEKVMRGEIYHSPSMTGILMLNELKKRKQL